MDKMTAGQLETGLSDNMDPVKQESLKHLSEKPLLSADLDHEPVLDPGKMNDLDLHGLSSGLDPESGENYQYGYMEDYQSLLCNSIGSFNLDFNISDLDFFPGGGGFNTSACDIGQSLHVTHDSGAFNALKELHYMIPVVVLYAIVILIGVAGNSMVVITVCRTKQMWNATNIFIANLAFAG